MAQIMRTGWFRLVHVKSRQSARWRALLEARRSVLNQTRSIENVVRAITREDGIKLGTPSRNDFAVRVREGRYQSGETEITGKISPGKPVGGDELARTGLVEAAHTLLVRSGKWSALRVWGLAVASRGRGVARAKAAVARKLAVILHGM